MLETAFVGEHYIPQGDYVIGAVHALDDLMALQSEWNALHARCARPGLFLTWDWSATWWEMFQEEEYRLWVLCARQADTGDLVGIAPLILMPQPGMLKRWRVLTLMALWAGYHLDFIIRAGEEVPVASAFMRYLHGRNREWDLIDLINLDTDSPCLDGLFKNDTWYTRYTDAYLYMEHEGTWDDYWMARTRKHRGKIVRQERHLQRDYPGQEITYRVDTDLAEGEHVLNALMAWLHSRWGDEGETLEHYEARAVSRFIRAVAERISRLGRMRLYSLWVGDEIAAAELVLMEEGTGVAHDFTAAFDRKWSDYGAGTLLFNHVIRDVIENGVHHLEMGEGVTDQKLRYSTGHHSDLYIRAAARREVQLWLQSVEAGRGAWTVIKKALPQNARDAIRQALGFGGPTIAE